MSNMAEEIARRMEAEGETPGAGGAPGSEGTQPTSPPPAAEPSNTDTGGGERTPETIPYARFKEVNDRYSALKDFEVLKNYGYDPDSLGRLAAFEAQYQTDPLGTMKSMVDNLNLPTEAKEAIKSSLDSAVGTPESGRAEGEPSNDTQKTPELPPEVQERLKYVDELRQREADRANEEQLNRVVAAWDRLDSRDGITVPENDEARRAYEHMRLMAISQTAGSGRPFRTVDELAEAARESVMAFRSAVLGAAVRTGRGGTPSLPSGPPAPSSPVKFDSIADATKAAKAAIERGELPTLG